MSKHQNKHLRSATAAFIAELLPTVLDAIRHAARARGYAVAVHGSLARDIDLIAVPWVDQVDPPDDLAKAIEGAVAGVLGSCAILPANEGATPKPHGRQCVTFVLPQTHVFIDLSIMPMRAT